MSEELVEVVEAFGGIHARLSLIVVVEGLGVDQHRNHRVPHATLDQVLQSDAVLARWLRHIPKLVLKVINLVLSLDALLQLRDDLTEEHVDYECVDRALVEYVQDAPEVMQRLWRLLVLHGKHEVKESLVVHLALESLQLFEDAIDEDSCETWRVARQLCFVKHTIFVLIKLQVLIIHSQRGLHREPILQSVLNRHGWLAQLVKLS